MCSSDLNSYNRMYGSIGAVIILMLWFYISGVAILIGGEVNSAIEREIIGANHEICEDDSTHAEHHFKRKAA